MGVCQSKCPEGGTRLPQAVGRGMECPVSLAWKSFPPRAGECDKVKNFSGLLWQISNHFTVRLCNLPLNCDQSV